MGAPEEARRTRLPSDTPQADNTTCPAPEGDMRCAWTGDAPSPTCDMATGGYDTHTTFR